MSPIARYGGPSDFGSLEIRLTEVEETLRRLLLDVADFIAQSPSDPAAATVALSPALASEQTVLRFTGGWVRDKLLGIESHDIDVAINNITGFQFGLRMKDYLEQPGISEKYGLAGVAQNELQSNKATKANLVGGLHKIEANPEKSKHLETVTTRILGLDIDLVNLRKETYTEDSRNPQMEFGTPEEDALRRDATINAMFFNLSTCKVEDFTQRGFNDIQIGMIRTPLEPVQTFKDDPLRVLRLIRFASRLGYKIDSEAESAMSRQDIKDALRVKISRERVGVELEKMLRGPDALRALQMIDQAGLYHTVFSDPTISYVPEVQNWTTLLADASAEITASNGLGRMLLHDADERYQAWVLACLVPFVNAPPLPSEPKRKPPPPPATIIAREGFKATNKIADLVTLSINHASAISGTTIRYRKTPKRKEPVNEADERAMLGMAVRSWGPTWRLQTFFALLAEYQDKPDEIETISSTFTAFVKRIEELSLSEAYDFRPLLDGKQLAKAIGIKPGPWMKDALDVVMQYQLRNPGTTDVDQAVAEVQSSQTNGELSADLISHFLRLTIRPLFSKAKNESVTDSGRRNTKNTPPRPIEISSEEDAVRPWRKPEHQVIGILTWAVTKLERDAVESSWGLLLPPLLTMLDDHDLRLKTAACQLLIGLLQKTDRKLLAKTGLGPVIQEALSASFGFLPTLTPAEESSALLTEAFPALLALHDAAYGREVSAGSVNMLDATLRKGILSVHSQCREIVPITLVLLRNLALIDDRLGLELVKHLKYVLPMLNDILCNPFSPTVPMLVSDAARALQSVIRNAWPRMAACKAEVLRGICVSWVNIEDDKDRSDISGAQKELRLALELLKEAVDDDSTFRVDLDVLLKAEPRLQTLFEQLER